MKMKIKIKVFFLLLVVVSTSMVACSITLYKHSYKTKSIEQLVTPNPAASVPFVVGYDNNPAKLDPVDTWDTISRNIQHQVVEGLVEYDLSDHPNYDIVPTLAEAWAWNSPLEISFMLRQGVRFHDGTLMTAEDVKWNFERVQYFINASGSLPATSEVAFPSQYFFHYDGTPIFKSFIADDGVDPYNFTIILNKPFGALLDLLCFGTTDILSPSSTPIYQYLDLDTDTLVGTGPFVYDGFTRDVDVRFHAFPNYWGGEARIKEMIWEIIEDDTARMNAALAGQYDYIQDVTLSYLNAFKADPDFHVEDFGENPCYFYLEFYCGPNDFSGTPLGNPQFQKNNATFRRALALAINYTYIHEEIHSGYSYEGTPCVPRAMPGHNASVVQASDSSFTWEDNIEKARDLIKTMWPIAAGWDSTYGGANEAEWTGNTFKTLQINRHFGSSTNMRLNILMDDNFALIGVDTFETIRMWSDYLNVGENSPWEMDLSYMGWCPDYLNPFTMINPLFNLESPNCFTRINDTSPGGLTELMDAAVLELNRTLQLEIYQDIQSLIYDINRSVTPASHAHISGWSYLLNAVHKVGLENVQYNILQILDFYLIEWVPDYFDLDSDADSPDLDGNFNLIWTSSQGADNYSVFTYSSFITEVNGSLTQLAFQIANSPYLIIGLSNGIYYFVIVAYNVHGDTLSNSIKVIVGGDPPDPFTLLSSADTPDTNGNFDLVWTNSQEADNYSVFTYSSFITEVNGSLTQLAFQNASSPYSITGLSNGIYYYVIVAYNEYGDTLSNCIDVEVQLEEKGDVIISGYNGYLFITILGLVSVILIFRSFKKK